MYRAIGVFFLINSVDIDDEEACKSVLDRIMVSIRYRQGLQEVLLNGVNVSPIIRTEEVSHAASLTSSYASVREKLLSLQQKLAEENDVVMDGRDIGTVVLPNAEVKIYLTASVEVRAMRRFKEYEAKGLKPDIEQLKEEIRERDFRDMNREHAPLKQAEDAVLVDSSDLTIAEVTECILDIIREKL
jgi:cytidylate kinase